MNSTLARAKILPAMVAGLLSLASAGSEAAPAAADPAAAPPQSIAAAVPDQTTSVPVPEETTSVPEPEETAPPTQGTSTTSTAAPTTTTTTTTLPPLVPPTFESVEGINLISEFTGFTTRGLSRWERYVPEIQDIRLTSTADGTEQPVLWLPPQGDGDRPLLVVLHSWSSNYVQHAGIPYAMWAQENGWAVVAPEFRGRNNHADAIGSDLAVQDVVDAIDFATAQDGVDETRVFAVGYSGGGMMALLLAGRHPEKVTAVAAWGSVYDLIAFYGRSLSAGRHYAWEIEGACGGNPRVEGPAQDECLRRSPMSYLADAREAGVPVYLGHGLQDSFLSPRQSAFAFNQLADPEDRLTDEQIESFGRWKVPEELAVPITIETYFGPGDPTVAFARQSASVWLVYFWSSHEMAYLATMRWFATDPQ